MFHKANILRTFEKFTGKHLYWLQYKCFLWIWKNTQETTFLPEYLRWLFLSGVNHVTQVYAPFHPCKDQASSKLLISCLFASVIKYTFTSLGSSKIFTKHFCSAIIFTKPPFSEVPAHASFRKLAQNLQNCERLITHECYFSLKISYVSKETAFNPLISGGFCYHQVLKG